MAKFPGGQTKVFHHHHASTAAIGVPVGEIGVWQWRIGPAVRQMIKARFQLTDIAALETLGPIRLQAHVRRNTRVLTDLIQLKPDAEFGGVTVSNFHCR
ncbi:hypothetical protein D3C86_1252090 [compost metagenome]